MPAQLNAVAVNVLSHQYCLDHTNDNHPAIVPGAELCAAVPDLDNDNLLDGGKDACQDRSLIFKTLFISFIISFFKWFNHCEKPEKIQTL